MARNSHPLIKLQGTIHNLTFVDSKAYGPHVRAPRGTYKTPPPNKVLQRNAKRTSLLNDTAQPVYRFAKQIANGFLQRNLWTLLLSRMRKCPSNQPADLLQSLTGLELNAAYPLDRFGELTARVQPSGTEQLCIGASGKVHPTYFQEAGADGYRFCAHLLWLDGSGRVSGNSCMDTGWKPLLHNDYSETIYFVLPPKARLFVLIGNIEGGQKGVPIETFATRGIRLLEAGKVSYRD